MVEQGSHGDFGRSRAPSHILMATPAPGGSMPQTRLRACLDLCHAGQCCVDARAEAAGAGHHERLGVMPHGCGPLPRHACSQDAHGSAMLAIARARLLSGVASEGMPQPSMP